MLHFNKECHTLEGDFIFPVSHAVYHTLMFGECWPFVHKLLIHTPTLSDNAVRDFCHVVMRHVTQSRDGPIQSL